MTTADFSRASMVRIAVSGALALLALAARPADAANTVFGADPFTGSTALQTPGRQVFAGLEQTLPSFNAASDTFTFDTAVFGINGPLGFVNALAAQLPAAGARVIVLQDSDNDNNAATPFAAGTAASLIAGQVATDGAGFFVYHNSVLGVNRLVFSTNLNDAGADLSVLARIASPTRLDSINALPSFEAQNFTAAVPEPSTYALMGLGLAGLAFARRRRAG